MDPKGSRGAFPFSTLPSMQLKRGDHNTNVTYWQAFLIRQGYSSVVADGGCVAHEGHSRSRWEATGTGEHSAARVTGL